MDRFFALISQFVSLSPAGKNALAGILEPLERPKGYVLVKPDTVCNYVYFVQQGLTRTFYLKDGKDVTDWFSPENSFACSVVSFITRQPDRRIIELLEPSRLWSLHHADLEELYSRHHELERLGRHLLQLGIVQMQQRFDDLHFATALERYQTLLNTTPTIVQRAPLGMIASYLGITPETLSRIRAHV